MNDDWIRQTLAMLARKRQQVDSGGTDPASVGPAMGFHPGPRGAVDQSQALGLGTADRAEPLMQAYQRYLKESGNKQDPLFDTQRTRRIPGGMHVDEQAPATLLRDETGSAFRVNETDNKRRGLTFQQVQLPGGQRANVYYGAGGERTVVRLPRRRK